MPTWDLILREIAQDQAIKNDSAFDRVRRKYLAQLFEYTKRNVITYYSGFLSKPRLEGIEINDEDKNGLMLCVHDLDRSVGLDLFLHTPGGDIAATESLVDYLRQMFGNDIRAIVPQIAMSAGTMIACSCKSIVMGTQSNIGPVDPQFNGIPAIGVIEEVRKAYREIMADQRAALVWGPILARIPLSFIQQCEWAVERSKDFLQDTLSANMFHSLPYADKTLRVKTVVDRLTDLSLNKGHNKHFHIADCQGMSLTIEPLEEDQTFQDIVLTIHHCYMHTLGNSGAFKIVENHLGRAWVKMQQFTLMGPPPMSFAPGGPS